VQGAAIREIQIGYYKHIGGEAKTTSKNTTTAIVHRDRDKAFGQKGRGSR
jgi:hypothetical protein